jgi:hypothetical protein
MVEEETKSGYYLPARQTWHFMSHADIYLKTLKSDSVISAALVVIMRVQKFCQ